jgi:CBS domain-containing protein
MTIRYSVIEIFTSEGVRCQNRVLYEAVLAYVRGLKIAARCTVFRGTDACYEDGETATQSIVDLSYNMPLKIEIILPTAELEPVMAVLETLVCEGIVGVRELDVHWHKARKRLLPPQVKIRDVMTPSPKRVGRGMPVDDVVRLLLSSTFTGVPVVDEQDRPVGVISQTDLIYRAKMPMRLALMANTEPETVDMILKSLSEMTAEAIMTQPDVHIHEDAPLTDAVNLMLEKNVKRLLVVDAWGKLTGIVSRMDVFKTITREAPDWKAVRKGEIMLADAHFVSDVMRRDTQTVQPETPVEEVLHMIDADDIQRVAVVDEAGRLLGLISDRNLLSAFSDDQPGIWQYLTRFIAFSEKGKRQKALRDRLRSRKAGEVMKKDVVSVREDAFIEDAIQIMTEKGFKRLPVVDEDGIYQGMINRDSLLRAGFESED